ncbi:MAG: NrdH-redoxin [Chloroflexi bacterium]|nr:NrdH-redoxin [Chloroflexota bacterium]
MDDKYSLHPSQIVMYTTRDCPDCHRARSYFERNHIHYLQVGLEGDEKAKKFVKSINQGNQSVPTIILPDGTILVEPSTEELDRVFHTA